MKMNAAEKWPTARLTASAVDGERTAKSMKESSAVAGELSAATHENKCGVERSQGGGPRADENTAREGEGGK